MMPLSGAAGEHRLESLRLSAEGYELKVDAPVTVRVEPRRLVVCMCSVRVAPAKISASATGSVSFNS